MSVFLSRQCTRPDDWTKDRTIMITIPFSLSTASWFSAAFVMTTVVVAPMSLRLSTSLVLAVLSKFAPVRLFASCSFYKEFADGCDQILNCMALQYLHNEVVSSIAVVMIIPAIGISLMGMQLER